MSGSSPNMTQKTLEEFNKLGDNNLMEKEYYKAAFEFAMEELKKEYKSKNNEDEFTIWFNMNYVEDSVDTITVSVASSFMKTMMTSKGYFAIVENSFRKRTAKIGKIFETSPNFLKCKRERRAATLFHH